MKRDLDLVRAILMKCEEHQHGYAPQNACIPGYTHEQIGFHIYLMGEAGLLRVIDVSESGAGSPDAVPLCMTWAGYEFLEASRNELLWSRAKIAAGAAGGMALDVVKAILVALVTDAAKKGLGLP